jgi:hypothetical protein
MAASRKEVFLRTASCGPLPGERERTGLPARSVHWTVEFAERRNRIELSLIPRVLSQSHQWETNNAANDAETHTHKATTQGLKQHWAKIANERLKHTGDEARAIREANAVIAREAERS